MADETKPNSTPESPTPAKPTPAETTSSAKPAAAPAGGASAGAGTPTAKPAPPPPKPSGPVPVPWNSELVSRFKRQYGSGIHEASTYLGQNYLVVNASIVYEILSVLRDEEEFDYCVDVTAVHYPQRELPFEVIYILYSFERNERMRVKTQIADGAALPSVVPLWPTANWLEREVYDMFGVRFEGHPDCKRILLPEDWKGHPLRKDYGIIQQDKEWVQINLGIESGQ
ncbi:MAG TPA: NADH-quinone oxidoreductase subunit C [Terriglobales bacterium]|nr:NADH-quinone oxidoreductase subunit C [Terriglobales bacterium]